MAVFLGIDPGLATVGFGVIESDKNGLRFIDCGIIKTPKDLSLPERLAMIETDLESLLKNIRPAAVGVEDLYFAKNVTTALKVAHARGVILAHLSRHHIPLFEFSPLQVKNGVTGDGKADKRMMQAMVQRLLNLKTPPKPDDAADALAVAILTSRFF